MSQDEDKEAPKDNTSEEECDETLEANTTKDAGPSFKDQVKGHASDSRPGAVAVAPGNLGENSENSQDGPDFKDQTRDVLPRC